MAGDTQITVVGNLVDEPELRYTPGGAAVVKFRIASTPRSFDRASGEWKEGDALFLRCVAWRQIAENIAESYKKGMGVIVVGALVQNNYETREGEKRTSYEIKVEETGPSLRFATAKVTKVTRSGGNNGFGAAAQRSVSNDDPWSSPAPAASSFDDPPF